ncbi:RNA polymerase sigma factor [Bittarella massiliensis (ex Durand et al. 2017)]|uniref:RNA polymerase sigma factor n=1 Tax=Bittarella massiliensis (ex Durand et al. 2017) TaxID=1720313 RepID=UPI001AA19884|nr:sigma-70 family RNA polymerase sigma factor [Bittarella massiliensis (ex Durand et al. 2017)]MBO1680581.1 sigma-70 family RNA polymerase sigma factor [Bittarella massiliensis (ex Durand et al. 2017)]
MQEDLTYRRLGALLQRAQRGEEDAFPKLYRATVYAQLVQAELLLKNPTLAEEAVQESYLTLYRRLPELHSPQALVAFLNRTTYLCCQNLRRVESRRAVGGEELLALVSDEDLQAQPEERALQREREAALRQAILTLPDRQRQAVVLRYYQRLPLQAVADQLGCSLSTAKRQLQLARQSLRRQLRGYLPVFLPLGWALSRTAAQGGAALPQPPRQLSLPQAALAGAGAIGLAAGLALLPCPDIQRVDSVPAGGGARVTVQATGAAQLVLRTPQGDLAFAALGAGEYALPAAPPGPATVVAQGRNGRRREVAVLVGDGDTSPPQLRDYWVEGGRGAVSLSDLSGVDWDTLSLTGADGAAVRPVALDREAGIAYFQIPDGQYRFTVCDLLGNRAEGPLWMQPPAAAEVE